MQRCRVPVSVTLAQITDSAEVAEDAGVTQPSTEDAGVAAGLDITISQYSDKPVVVRDRGTYNIRLDLKRLAESGIKICVAAADGTSPRACRQRLRSCVGV